jgi:hypothetical protein
MLLKVLGRPMIILDSYQAAVDLLDKKGLIYSDRPTFTLYELCAEHHTASYSIIQQTGYIQPRVGPYSYLPSVRRKIQQTSANAPVVFEP